MLTKLDSESLRAGFHAMYGVHGIDDNPKLHPFAEPRRDRHRLQGERRLRRPGQPLRHDGLSGQAVHRGVHRRRGLRAPTAAASRSPRAATTSTIYGKRVREVTPGASSAHRTTERLATRRGPYTIISVNNTARDDRYGRRQGAAPRPADDRPRKPAVPFAGRYRIIDFVLSNFVNSGLRGSRCSRSTSRDADQHLARVWRLSAASASTSRSCPRRCASASSGSRAPPTPSYQNLNLVRDERAEHVCVFGGDHVYKMDVDQMVEQHIATRRRPDGRRDPGAGREASAFGIIDVDDRGRIVGFVEKPKNPPEMPGRPGLVARLDGQLHLPPRRARARARRRRRERDRAPRLRQATSSRASSPTARSVFVYDFAQNHIPGEPEGAEPYWRDVGTIDSYFDVEHGPAGASPGARPLQPAVAYPQRTA